jgi:hypothetical protein
MASGLSDGETVRVVAQRRRDNHLPCLGAERDHFAALNVPRSPAQLCSATSSVLSE